MKQRKKKQEGKGTGHQRTHLILNFGNGLAKYYETLTTSPTCCSWV